MSWDEALLEFPGWDWDTMRHRAEIALQWDQGLESDMSLIVAIPTSAGIVMAGDCRSVTSGGVLYTDTTQKVFKLSNKVLIGATGNNRFDKAVINKLLARTDATSDISEIGEWVRDIAIAEYKQQSELNPKHEKGTDQFLLTGYEEGNGKIISCYAGNSFAPVEWDTQLFAYSGTTFLAQFLLNMLYRDSISLEEAKFLSVFVICASASLLTVVSAENLQLFAVTSQGVEEADATEVALLKQNVSKSPWRNLIPSQPELEELYKSLQRPKPPT